MAKQLLIYQDVVPVTAEAHGNSTLKQITSFEFARELRIAPILISEFRRACLDYPIVFITGEDQVPFPVVVLAVGDQENQYLDDQARWNADYIPAFVRRYPFVFTKSPDDDQYYLCVDQHYGNLHQSDDGEKLFDESGQPSSFTQQMLDFLKAYEIEHRATKDFCQELQELNLFEGKQLSSKPENGEQSGEDKTVRLSGFMTIDRSRISTLTDQKALNLQRQGGLEIIHYHWASLENFNRPRFDA